MKVADFAYRVAVRTMELLEQEKGYKIPDDLRKTVTDRILAELTELITGCT